MDLLVNIRSIIFLFVFILLSCSTSYAIPRADLNVNEVFYEGDSINFEYRIISDENIDVEYSAGISCESEIHLDLIEIKERKLNKDEPFYGEYEYGKVQNDFQSSDCIAYVSFLSPYSFNIQKAFRIETKPSFSFDVKICKDKACSKPSKIFLKGEEIYLDYFIDVENPYVTAVLSYPDKTTKQLTLPASIKAEQIGNYELEITASKQGYKTINKKELLGVIEEEAVIKQKDITKKDIMDLSIFAYGTIIILILIILVYLVQKNWKQKRPKNDRKKDNLKIINNKLVKAKNLIKKGKLDSAKSAYDEIILIYNKLPENQKKLLYREMQELYKRIK